jgi:hypothetical protein
MEGERVRDLGFRKSGFQMNSYSSKLRERLFSRFCGPNHSLPTGWRASTQRGPPGTNRNPRGAIQNNASFSDWRTSMNLRQLTTEEERQFFAACLTEARSTRGAGFRDKPKSRLTESHLAFGDLYALFEDDERGRGRMVGGFALHDLATLPQSHPSPDMSHLPAESVFEGTELWSLSKGIAPIAASAAAAVAGIVRAKAILVYPICRPFDLSAPYGRFNFRPCEPVKFPYGQTNDGDEIWVRPMVLEGEKLEEYIRAGFDFLFRSRPDHGGLEFTINSPASPTRAAARLGELRVETPHAHHGDERNGSAAI